MSFPLSSTSVILLLWFYLVTGNLLATSVDGDDKKWPFRTFRSEAKAFPPVKLVDTKDSVCRSSEQQSPGPTAAPTTNASGNTETKRKRKSLVKIVNFTADKTLRSQPLPLPSSDGKSVDDFFAEGKHVDIQFSDRAHVEQIPDPDESIMETFRRLNAERRIEAGLKSVADDVHSTRIVGLQNPPLHCLGLTLHSVTQVAIQVLKGSHGSGRPNQERRFPGFPELQLTLLETTFEATGPSFLVRLFYKIMPPSGSVADRQEAVDTIGFTRIWAEPAKGDEKNSGDVIFVNQARLETHIRVPSLLMKVMPMSQKRMEVRGSKTLQNAIEKDMVPAMERFVNAYLEWAS